MPLVPCPVCTAAVEIRRGDGGGPLLAHIGWHEATGTLADWTQGGALYAAQQVADEALAADDDAPTMKLPPIGETVRRRPPVPPTLIPGTPAQWRALAAAMEDDGLDVEALAVEVRTAGHPVSAAYCGDPNGDFTCIEPAGHPGRHYAAGVSWE